LTTPAFKVVEFDHFKSQSGLPNFVMSVSEWIEKTTEESSLKINPIAIQQMQIILEVENR
jgi:hypothetical protein